MLRLKRFRHYGIPINGYWNFKFSFKSWAPCISTIGLFLKACMYLVIRSRYEQLFCCDHMTIYLEVSGCVYVSNYRFSLLKSRYDHSLHVLALQRKHNLLTPLLCFLWDLIQYIENIYFHFISDYGILKTLFMQMKFNFP